MSILLVAPHSAHLKSLEKRDGSSNLSRMTPTSVRRPGPDDWPELDPMPKEAPVYDAIIVGARCAGSPTAMLLARKGYQVLLLDRAHFPSDTLSVHYIHQTGMASLARWGLLERVAETNCPPVTRQTINFGPFALRGAPPPADGIAEAYAPRRFKLDHILVRAAADAGAELRERFTVRELVFDGERVVGVRGSTAGAGGVTEHARIVIGADGLHSTVARGVQAPAYDEQPTFTCAYYTYWSGVEVDEPELYIRPGQAIITAPTNDDQTIVIVYWPRSQFHTVRRDIETHFWQALDIVPALAERLRAGTRAERFRGTGDLPNYYRKPFGPGWALVGDAGYHKDPITAEGITDAFRDAELLANAIDDGFAGRLPLEAALARYEQDRNAASRALYEMTCQFASLQPPPEEQRQLLEALQHNPLQTNRFIGLLAGTVSPMEFFSPENIGEVMSSTDARQAVPAG
jgi:flavin-dependent dehydrogenase